jgi:hypothetical protein
VTAVQHQADPIATVLYNDFIVNFIFSLVPVSGKEEKKRKREKRGNFKKTQNSLKTTQIS